MLAKLVRLANHKIVDRVQFSLLDLKASDIVFGMSRAGRTFARLFPDSLAVVVASGTVRLAARLRMSLVLIQPLLNGLWCILWLIGGRIGVLLKNLQFGQRDDITICGLMPDGLLRRAIVIVEPIGFRIKQLPPLRRVRPLNGNALEKMKQKEQLKQNSKSC